MALVDRQPRTLMQKLVDSWPLSSYRLVLRRLSLSNNVDRISLSAELVYIEGPS